MSLPGFVVHQSEAQQQPHKRTASWCYVVSSVLEPPCCVHFFTEIFCSYLCCSKARSLILWECCFGGINQVWSNIQLHMGWLEQLIDLVDKCQNVTPYNRTNQKAIRPQFFSKSLDLFFRNCVRQTLPYFYKCFTDLGNLEAISLNIL